MQINWHMPTYNRMTERAQVEVNSAREWLLENEPLTSPYLMKVTESHPAIWFSSIMTLIEHDIDSKVQGAVDLGCMYVIQERKTPFGRIHKDNILVRLKRNNELIKERFIPKLIDAHERMLRMKYKPREVKALGKLLEKIS